MDIGCCLTLILTFYQNRILWCKKFDSCEVVYAPIDLTSVLGTCAISRDQMSGYGADIPTQDKRLYEDRFYLCTPVNSQCVGRQILGVILCIRKSGQFSDAEIEHV